MHQALKAWLYARRAVPVCGGYEMWRGHGPGGHRWGGAPEEGPEEGFGGGFGVRRPLRFLMHKLELDERQVAELARIMDELKTERAQAEVDRRRTVSAFADALAGDAFDVAKAAEGGDQRVKSAERLRDALLKALPQIHALLNPEQRSRLAYLIRTGALSV
jgi:Spy/CpxP family protein refolding chaperone